MHLKKYDKLVIQAKALVKEINDNKWKVAKLALEAVDIKTGGHLKEVYSISKFADDIGLHRKTLSNWITEYKTVVVHLPEESLSLLPLKGTLRGAITRTYQEASRTNQKDPEVIRDLFNKQFYRNQEDRELETFLRQMRNLEFFINKKIVLKKMDQQHLSELLFNCNKITNGLNKHFRDYERPQHQYLKTKTRFMLRNDT
jgi:hypothetical protein